MKIYEYQAAQLFRDYGIPVPDGRVAATPEEARVIASAMGHPVVVKAQVLVGGRGKAGGVALARTPEEARDHARRILGMSIKGVAVGQVLVSRAVDIASEYYLGLAVDRSSKSVQCIASASGGVDIEEVAAKTPERIVRFPVLPSVGLDRISQYPELARVFPGVGLADQAWGILGRLLKLMVEKDCTLVEVNPLILEAGGRLVAADAKVIVDDNGLFRHPDIEGMRASEEYSAEEVEARANGLAFVGLDGAIGCIVNGAGLAMATMDIVKQAGGRPANFLDVGGSSNPDKVVAALRLLLGNPRLEAILINIFGGITRCDDIARGILQARATIAIPVPLVIRLVGTNEAEARRLLAAEHIEASSDLGEAVRRVVSLPEAAA